MSDEGVRLELTEDEALVLFEDTDRLEVVDEAETRVLWRLQGGLESKLIEAFLPNYLDLIQQARDRLRPPAEWCPCPGRSNRQPWFRRSLNAAFTSSAVCG